MGSLVQEPEPEMFPRLSQYSSLCSVYLGLQCVNNVTIQHYMASLHTTISPRPSHAYLQVETLIVAKDPKIRLRDPV